MTNLAVSALATSQPAEWHEYLAWTMLALGFASALVILVDELVLGHRQHMRIMNLVHPITALYWGPVWLWAYFTRGRKSSKKWARQEAMRLLDESSGPQEAKRKAQELQEQGSSTDARNRRPWHVSNADSHCGAGCTLGDIAGEWLVFMLGIVLIGQVRGHAFFSEIVLDFAFAWTFGVLFQYFTIVPMREVGPIKGIWQAMKVDTASIVAFQVGLFGWMAIFMLVLWPHSIHVNSPDFWFQMQIGMIVGFFTAWPVNHWLVRRGIKEKMDYRRHLGMVLEHLADEHGDEATPRERGGEARVSAERARR